MILKKNISSLITLPPILTRPSKQTPEKEEASCLPSHLFFDSVTHPSMYKEIFTKSICKSFTEIESSQENK